MQTLAGRTCVFAGATGLIGREAVRALAEGGMNVIMMTHMIEDAETVAKELADCPGKVLYMSTDLSADEVYQKTFEEFGSIDVVVSSTGVLNRVKPFHEITKKELEDKLLHQVSHPFETIQKTLPYLKKSKAPRIILTASAGAQNGFSGENITDNIARGAVISMTYSLAREFMDHHITVNCIARSGLINDHIPSKPEDYDVSSISGQIPAGFIGTGSDYGALVAYLASEESRFVTGQVFSLSGGIQIG